MNENASTAPFTHPDRYTRGTDAAMYTTLGLPVPTVTADAIEYADACNDAFREDNREALRGMKAMIERMAAQS